MAHSTMVVRGGSRLVRRMRRLCKVERCWHNATVVGNGATQRDDGMMEESGITGRDGGVVSGW